MGRLVAAQRTDGRLRISRTPVRACYLLSTGFVATVGRLLAPLGLVRSPPMRRADGSIVSARRPGTCQTPHADD
jgi:hypothetical protein